MNKTEDNNCGFERTLIGFAYMSIIGCVLSVNINNLKRADS